MTLDVLYAERPLRICCVQSDVFHSSSAKVARSTASLPPATSVAASDLPVAFLPICSSSLFLATLFRFVHILNTARRSPCRPTLPQR
jgi:hypothetical protein